VARKRRGTDKLPLDDQQRWRPLAEVYKALCHSTGSPQLAALILTEAMAKPGGVRSMRWRAARVPDEANPDEYPECELLSPTFWAEQHELLSTSDTLLHPDGLVIGLRSRHGQIMTADAARGYAFFAWRPDLEKAWPTVFQPAKRPKPRKAKRADDKAQSRPGSADAWIDHLFPNGEWRVMTAKQIHKAIANYAKERGWKKFSSYSAVAAAVRRKRQT
jgi:hypothetical protein